jgi:hypothetical protein
VEVNASRNYHNINNQYYCLYPLVLPMDPSPSAPSHHPQMLLSSNNIIRLVLAMIAQFKCIGHQIVVKSTFSIEFRRGNIHTTVPRKSKWSIESKKYHVTTNNYIIVKIIPYIEILVISITLYLILWSLT